MAEKNGEARLPIAARLFPEDRDFVLNLGRDDPTCPARAGLELLIRRARQAADAEALVRDALKSG